MVADPSYVVRSWRCGRLTTEEAARLLLTTVEDFYWIAFVEEQLNRYRPEPEVESDITRMSKEGVLHKVLFHDIGIDEAAELLCVSEEEAQKLFDEWVEEYEKWIEKECELQQQEWDCFAQREDDCFSRPTSRAVLYRSSRLNHR